MKANYHTHTARCHHAQGSDEAFVQAAVDAGYDVLGIADHAPWPFKGRYVSGIRMTCGELPGYIASFRSLKEQHADRIRLHIGLESEFFPRYMDHIRRMQDAGVSYLLLGQHFVDSEEDHPAATRACLEESYVLRYADSVADALRTGLFAYLAHPDLFMKYRTEDQFTHACERAADVICQAAQEAAVPLEYNLLGRKEGVGYPAAPFWQYARKWNNPVILGVDVHAPEHLLDNQTYAAGKAFLENLGYQIIDCLEMDR